MSQLPVLSRPDGRLTAFRMIENSWSGAEGHDIFYGIEAYAGEDLLLQLEDVTCDRHWMEQFIEKINRAGLSILHLDDILAENLPYRIIEKSYQGEEGDYIGFGIEAYAGEELLMQLPDVTCDRIWMEQFVQKINRGGLSPLHLYDVLIDYLP